MSSLKVAETAHLRRRQNRAGDDSFKLVPCLHFQGTGHGVRGLADGNHQHSVVSMKIVEVFADAQHAAFTGDMTLKSLVDTGFCKCVLEKMPRRNAHLDGQLFPIRGCRRHGKNYTSGTKASLQP